MSKPRKLDDTLKNKIHNMYVAYLEKGFSEEQAMEQALDFARLQAAARAQWMTLDEETGKPRWGARPGIVDEALSLASLPQQLGIVDASPEWATRASERQDRLSSAISSEMGVSPAEGIGEHVLDAAGTMGAQLPMPAAAFRRAGDVLKPISAVLEKAPGVVRAPVRGLGSILGAGSEYLTPTVNPTVGNYLAGTLFGAGTGLVGDLGGPEEEQVNYAEGGKVGALSKALQTLSKIIQGDIPVHADLDALKAGIHSREVAGVPPASRELINKTSLIRKYGTESHELDRAAGLDEELLNQLAEVYFNPRVIPASASKTRHVDPAAPVRHANVADLDPTFLLLNPARKAAGGNVRNTDMGVLTGLQMQYADGGRVARTANAVKTIKEAIGHLRRGDHTSAASLLRGSKEAMAEKSISDLVGRFGHPQARKDASDVMGKMVEEDTNATAMLAKGGKVKKKSRIPAHLQSYLKG